MNESADYHAKNINRKLTLLAGHCLFISGKKRREKAGKILEELEMEDLPKLIKRLQDGKKD